jgi:hypothetical protein
MYFASKSTAADFLNSADPDIRSCLEMRLPAQLPVAKWREM